jgi:CheY-like chemotaxis protein
MQDVIERQVRQLTRLVDDLLDVARITRGRIDLRRQRVELHSVVQGAVEAAQPLITQQGHHLEVQLPEAPVWLLADPARLSQVLMNLLTNAAKYTPAGGRISVRAGVEGDQAVLRVRDSGIGLAPEHLASVFEMFSQVAPALERSQGGLGIGLALVRGLVALHGGRVEAYSEGPGKGSEFTVKLPLQRVPLNQQQGSQKVRRDSGFLAAHFGGSTVLLAEDNEVNALVAEFALKRLGVHVEHVDSGVDVVARMCTLGERPDLVLLDCQMPVMDGFQAARRVRAYEREHGLRRAPLVALTANVFQSDRDRCREAGMDAFLGKPFTEEELRDVLEMFAVVPLSEPAALDAIPSTYAARL